jgi:hypothetical protein
MDAASLKSSARCCRQSVFCIEDIQYALPETQRKVGAKRGILQVFKYDQTEVQLLSRPRGNH